MHPSINILNPKSMFQIENSASRRDFKDFHYVIHWVKVLCGLRFYTQSQRGQIFLCFFAGTWMELAILTQKALFGQVKPILAKANKIGTNFSVMFFQMTYFLGFSNTSFDSDFTQNVMFQYYLLGYMITGRTQLTTALKQQTGP